MAGRILDDQISYAIKKEPDVFDRGKLEKAAASLSEGFTLSMIDERLYHLCRVQRYVSSR